MNFKSIILNSLLIASSVFGIVNTAFAANITTINGEDGTVYQIDLDDLTEAKTEDGETCDLLAQYGSRSKQA
jgi:hypothetical protein